jgi:hypothetical protein
LNKIEGKKILCKAAHIKKVQLCKKKKKFKDQIKKRKISNNKFIIKCESEQCGVYTYIKIAVSFLFLVIFLVFHPNLNTP